MKASELYENYENEVDQLQKAIHNHVRDLGSLCHTLAEKQEKMRMLALILIKEGDRPLSGIEIMALRPAEEKAATQSDVLLHLAKENHVA